MTPFQTCHSKCFDVDHPPSHHLFETLDGVGHWHCHRAYRRELEEIAEIEKRILADSTITDAKNLLDKLTRLLLHLTPSSRTTKYNKTSKTTTKKQHTLTYWTPTTPLTSHPETIRSLPSRTRPTPLSKTRSLVKVPARNPTRIDLTRPHSYLLVF